MKSYSSRGVIQLLKEDGWYEVNVVDKDIPRKTLDSIERQLGLLFR